MLILITGITGMVGKACASAALKAGHAVRGLGRNPDRLDESIAGKLEGFQKATGIYDLNALDLAVQGVDAVVCAYTPETEVIMEGQLLLLRAAQRHGVKVYDPCLLCKSASSNMLQIFHANSWNYDWTKQKLGDHELYDEYVSFMNHVRLSSSIKPIYMFTGAIMEWVFCSPRDNFFDRETKTVSYFGKGDEKWIYSTVDDLAAYTIAAVAAPNATEGGVVRVQSFRASPFDIAAAYENARGTKASTHCLGSVEDVDKLLEESRRTTDPTEYTKYIGLGYVLHTLKGTWEYEAVDCERFKEVKQTSLRQWFKEHPEI
ncbi:hypothetical protein N7526_001942 [Penicillium atrosanguineum]|nr:hypothetical protein N7526_001942 [Penicillium atrosanguineum]